MTDRPLRIAFVGGTGPAGIGLGARLARAGHSVRIGSRTKERAEDAAARIRELVPDADVGGETNEMCCDGADVVLLTMRDDAQRETVHRLADQLAG